MQCHMQQKPRKNGVHYYHITCMYCMCTERLNLYVCMYVCIYVHMFFIYLCIHVCTYVRTYVCMYACMHVCMYVCMYVVCSTSQELLPMYVCMNKLCLCVRQGAWLLGLHKYLNVMSPQLEYEFKKLEKIVEKLKTPTPRSSSLL